MPGEDIKGHLDALLLAVVAQGPVHGCAALERLRERSGGRFDLPEGTVYPALHRLEAAGLLSSRWIVVDARKRRQYELTSRGRTELRERTRAWHGFSGAVEMVLGVAPAGGAA